MWGGECPWGSWRERGATGERGSRGRLIPPVPAPLPVGEAGARGPGCGVAAGGVLGGAGGSS